MLEIIVILSIIVSLTFDNQFLNMPWCWAIIGKESKFKSGCLIANLYGMFNKSVSLMPHLISQDKVLLSVA